MKINFLLKLTETDKRFILAFIAIIFVILALFILITLLISSISKRLSYKIDSLMHDVVVTGVIDSKEKFIKVAKKKSSNYFFKQSFIPMSILLISLIVLLSYGYGIGKDFSSLFTDYSTNGVGFATLFYIYDFSSIEYVDTILGSIPQNIPLLSSPHFSINAIVSYIFVTTFLIGGVWFLIFVQAYLARNIRAHHLASSIYSKRLDNVKFDNLMNFKYTDGEVTYVTSNHINDKNENENNQSNNN